MVGLTIPKKRSASGSKNADGGSAKDDAITKELASSCIERDPLEEPSETHQGDDDDVIIITTESKKRKSSSGGGKKFRTAWLSYDIFKNWLQPHADPELAACVVCNRVIKAGKSELEKHASARRHVEMMKKKKASEEGDQLTPAVLLREVDGSYAFDLHEVTLILLPFSGALFNFYLSTGAEELPIQPAIENNLPVSSQRPIESSVTPNSDDHYATGVLVPVQPQQKSQLVLPHEVTTITSSKATVLKAAPHWKTTAIVNGHVTRLDLHDYKGRYLVLVFYPQDFARLCASELNRLSDRIEEFRAIQADIVACSTDSHLSHLAWLKRPRIDNGVASLKLPLLADPTQTICKDYGVYLPDKGHALRAHFIIDGRGILRHASINDPLIGRGTDEMLRIIQALQYADEVQAALPVDWLPHH